MSPVSLNFVDFFFGGKEVFFIAGNLRRLLEKVFEYLMN